MSYPFQQHQTESSAVIEEIPPQVLLGEFGEDSDNPLSVSVIIPAYRQFDNLTQLIKQLQMLPCLHEIIIVDDGSTRLQHHELLLFRMRWRNVRVFHQSHQGAGAARNFGLSKATGNWVWFVDSDDMVNAPLVFDTLKTVSPNDEIDIIRFQAGKVLPIEDRPGQYGVLMLPTGTCPVSLLQPWKEGIPLSHHTKYLQSGPKLLFRSTYNKSWIPAFCWSLFRRKFLLDNEIRFPEWQIAEDQVFYISALLAADGEHSVLESPDVVYYYVHNPKSVSFTTPKKEVLASKQKTKDCLRALWDKERSRFSPDDAMRVYQALTKIIDNL